MPAVVEALFEDLRAILLKPDQAAGIFPSAKVRWRRATRWRPARTGAGSGGHSWLRYLQCHVFARPDFATGGPHGGAPRGAPRGPLAGGLRGGGAPHFAMGGTASRRPALTEPRCASERGLAMGGGRPRSAASRWAANPWLGAIARCSRTGSSNPSPSSEESMQTSSSGRARLWDGGRGDRDMPLLLDPRIFPRMRARMYRRSPPETGSTRKARRPPGIVSQTGMVIGEPESGARIYNRIIGRPRSHGGQTSDRARP